MGVGPGPFRRVAHRGLGFLCVLVKTPRDHEKCQRHRNHGYREQGEIGPRSQRPVQALEMPVVQRSDPGIEHVAQEYGQQPAGRDKALHRGRRGCERQFQADHGNTDLRHGNQHVRDGFPQNRHTAGGSRQVAGHSHDRHRETCEQEPHQHLVGGTQTDTPARQHVPQQGDRRQQHHNQHRVERLDLIWREFYSENGQFQVIPSKQGPRAG